MDKKVYISVSTDPVKDYSQIYQYARDMQGVADFLHCDVMDGKFVRKRNYGPEIVADVNSKSLIMLDVHLMCKEPLEDIEAYLKAGANILTVHYEAFKNKEDIIRAKNKIKEKNALAGISISPDTPIKNIKMFIHDFDLVLVMSVVPGASGQKFMPEALDRIRELANIRKENNYHYKIEVDGGVNPENVKEVIDAGADMIVSGSYVYNADNRKVAVDSLRG